MTLVTRDFTQADSSTIANSTELGGVGDWQVISNKLRCNTLAGALGYYWREDTDVGSSDMFAQCTVTSSQASANSNSGVMLRAQTGSTNTSYQVTGRHAGDVLWVWRIVAGTETQMNWQTGATALSVAWASGDVVRGEVIGSLIRGKINGVLVGLCVDTNIASGSRGGVNGWNETTPDFVEVDDWSAGALIADGGLVAPFIKTIGAQVTGTGTSLSPAFGTPSAGDLVVVQCTSRDAAQTMNFPASQGWVAGPNPSQTGLEDAVFLKVWGLGGQTDSTTPAFTIGSGTAGWGATATVYGNPKHATNPWTSVASALVASGSSTDATTTSATRSCPNVSYTGNNVTLVRLLSSGDDNALLTNSEGALVYGGANYDSTTGNDFSQAQSCTENVNVASSTGTATFAETVLGNDISNGITLVLGIPSSGTTVNAIAEIDALLAAARSASITSAGLAETDALSAGAHTSNRASGALVEADVLAAAAHTHAVAVGVLTESDALVTASRSITAQLGLLSEVDSLLAGAATHSRIAGALGETDALLSTSATHDRPAALLTEVDALLSLSGSRTVQLGALGELDALTAAVAEHARQGGLLTELDVLSAVVPPTSLGALAEIDLLAPAGHSTDRPVLALAELDVLQPAARSTEQVVGLLLEVEALLAAGSSSDRLVGLLGEIDELLAPIVAITDHLLSAGDLQMRRAVGALVARKRSASGLTQRVRAGDMLQHRITIELQRRVSADDLEAEP